VFCKELHRERSDKSSDTEEDHKGTLDLRAAGLAGVWTTVKSLITNGPYVFNVLYETMDDILIDGTVSFGVKYVQQQFGQTASMAGIIWGQSLLHSELPVVSFWEFPRMSVTYILITNRKSHALFSNTSCTKQDAVNIMSIRTCIRKNTSKMQ